MVCEHLRPLEHALAAAGIAVGFRGQAWSEQCREWVYYSAVLDMKSIRPYLPDCVEPHENLDPRSGQERGFSDRKRRTCTDSPQGSGERETSCA